MKKKILNAPLVKLLINVKHTFCAPSFFCRLWEVDAGLPSPPQDTRLEWVWEKEERILDLGAHELFLGGEASQVLRFLPGPLCSYPTALWLSPKAPPLSDSGEGEGEMWAGLCLISPFISGGCVLLPSECAPLNGPCGEEIAVLFKEDWRSLWWGRNRILDCPGESLSSLGDFWRLLTVGLSWSSLKPTCKACLLVRPAGLRGRAGPEVFWAFGGSLEAAVRLVGSACPEVLVLRVEALRMGTELRVASWEL